MARTMAVVMRLALLALCVCATLAAGPASADSSTNTRGKPSASTLVAPVEVSTAVATVPNLRSRQAAMTAAASTDEVAARALAVGCDPCPFGEYMVQACAGGSDTTPQCALCSSTCPTGTELVEPCGISNDRVCVPKEHAACARKAVTLTVASLNSIMEDSCENCGSYVGHINTALKEGYMACPLRLSAFIAQARHATDGFKYLKSQASNGAGAIHLQPSNFRLACLQVPELKTAFVAAFGSCDISSSQHSAAANIVARPEYAFRVAVWWFRTGSSQLLGDPCGDLRFDADYGLGGAPFFTTRQSPGVGYQKVTTCIASFGVDPGRQQRADYYVAARAYFPDKDPDHSILGAAPRTASTSVTAVLVATVALSAAMWSRQ